MSADRWGIRFDATGVEATFGLPCQFEYSTGRATMGWIVVPDWGRPGDDRPPGIGRVVAFAADDEPLGIGCAGQDFSFNFFSAEMEILNSDRLGPQGYFQFPLEIVRETDAFARTTTRDESTIGSTSVLEQTVTLIAVSGD